MDQSTSQSKTHIPVSLVQKASKKRMPKANRWSRVPKPVAEPRHVSTASLTEPPVVYGYDIKASIIPFSKKLPDEIWLLIWRYILRGRLLRVAPLKSGRLAIENHAGVPGAMFMTKIAQTETLKTHSIMFRESLGAPVLFNLDTDVLLLRFDQSRLYDLHNIMLRHPEPQHSYQSTENTHYLAVDRRKRVAGLPGADLTYILWYWFMERGFIEKVFIVCSEAGEDLVARAKAYRHQLEALLRAESEQIWLERRWKWHMEPFVWNSACIWQQIVCVRSEADILPALDALKVVVAKIVGPLSTKTLRSARMLYMGYVEVGHTGKYVYYTYR